MHDAPARGGRLTGRGAVLRFCVRIAAAGMLAAVLTLAVPVRPAAQEEAGAFSIRVAATIAASVGSKVVLPIEVGPAGAIPKGSFVTVRGLPPAVALEDGHAVGPGWWAVPLSALPSLTAQVPDGIPERSEMVISLIAPDGRLLAQSRSALAVQSVSGPAPAPPPPPVAPQLTEEQRVRAERMLARGEAYLANGNIMGARDFFERAADAGLVAAAMRLAATYDPSVLKRMETQGVAADVALARKWYERARALGSPDADEALRRLGK